MAELLIKNKEYELNIDTLCGNGNGVGRIDGFVVFVPGTAAGDTVRVKIIKVTKSYAVGKLVQIVSPSPSRCDDKCPVSSRCGGCSFGHITYEAECEIKKAMINDSFSHIGGLDLAIDEFFGAQEVTRYRNKAMYPVAQDRDGKLVSGFYAAMSHRVIEHDDCLIGPAIFSKIKDAALEIMTDLDLSAYDEEKEKGLVRSIYMRKSADDKVLLTIIANADSLGNENEKAFCQRITGRFPEIRGILLNTNKKAGNSLLGEKWRTLWGDEYLYDTLCGKKFRIAPAAFYQVNHAQTERLYAKAREMAQIKKGDVVFDLYCGTGTIGIIMAEDDVKLVGVEISKEATIDAAHNAKENGVDAEFVCLDAGEALDTPRLKEKHPDVIIIDPPRKGCGEEAAKKISSFGADRIVYISCNPQTLARDLVTFKACGYSAEKAVGVDLFPRTGHVESIVSLKRIL
ncbi:MAG: 23S rRNA (uracil(1939)-C(5))-methyltransferase RlmD [Clostridia bacterium]|nr:23S rRNA (uracil(1939)-C(5))-methyltransferase RlmD [Clostridia bacterium]